MAGSTGETIITVAPAKSEFNIYKYKVGDAAEDVAYEQNVRTWKLWDGISSIEAENGKIITVVEATKDYKAIAAGSTTVVAG